MALIASPIVHKVPMSSIMKSIDVQVSVVATGARLVRIRLWLASCIMRFAMWVFGCSADIETLYNPASGNGVDRRGIPIRYGIDTPGYSHTVGSNLRVYLDGVEIPHVVAYDMEAGTVTRHALGPRGFILSPDRENTQTDTLTGDLTVDWR